MGRVLRQRPCQLDEQKSKVKKSRAEIQKAYRKRLQDDPEQYAQ